MSLMVKLLLVVNGLKTTMKDICSIRELLRLMEILLNFGWVGPKILIFKSEQQLAYVQEDLFIILVSLSIQVVMDTKILTIL
jgi:hypothetical protein